MRSNKAFRNILSLQKTTGSEKHGMVSVGRDLEAHPIPPLLWARPLQQPRLSPAHCTHSSSGHPAPGRASLPSGEDFLTSISSKSPLFPFQATPPPSLSYPYTPLTQSPSPSLLQPLQALEGSCEFSPEPSLSECPQLPACICSRAAPASGCY